MAKITLEDGTILTGELIDLEEEVSEVEELLNKSDELLALGATGVTLDEDDE